MKIKTIRSIDEMGRIIIPFQIRNELGWYCDDEIQITPEEDYLVLQKPSNNEVKLTIIK